MLLFGSLEMWLWIIQKVKNFKWLKIMLMKTDELTFLRIINNSKIMYFFFLVAENDTKVIANIHCILAMCQFLLLDGRTNIWTGTVRLQNLTLDYFIVWQFSIKLELFAGRKRWRFYYTLEARSQNLFT